MKKKKKGGESGERKREGRGRGEKMALRRGSFVAPSSTFMPIFPLRLTLPAVPFSLFVYYFNSEQPWWTCGYRVIQEAEG